MWEWHATFRRCTSNLGNVAHMKYTWDNRQCPT